MNINTNIYGLPETWYTPTGDFANKPATKLPTWGNGYYNHYYFGGFDTGVFSANGAPVDNSLALWGVNKQAPFARPYFFFPTLAVDSNYVYTTAPEVHLLNVLSEENSVMPMTAAVYGSNLSTRANSTPSYQYTPNAATPLQWTQAACQPILDFKYNNIVLCPYIIAARETVGTDDSGLDFTTYSITDYFDNGGQSAYPYIVAVNADVYISTSSINTRSKNNDALKLWYSKEYAAHVSSWQGTFTQYIAPYYSVQPSSTIRISGGYSNAVDSSWNYNFGSNQSFTTISEAFARFSRIGYSDSPTIVLDNGNYQYKVVANRGYCTITSIWENATKDEVLKEVAYLGYWFCDDSTTAINAANGQNCTSDSMHIPLFDDSGVTTGEWLSGTAAAAIAPADDETARTIAPDYDPNYNPTPGGDEDTGDLSNITKNRFSNAGGLAQWVVSQQTLLQLQAYLNGSYLPTAADLDADFKGTNPQQYIVSVQKYPYDVPYQGTLGNIYIGKNDTSLTGYKLFADWGGASVLPINSVCTEDFGTIQIPSYYGDFRDYLSKIIIFLPFIGTAELDPRLYIGHSVGLIYTIDYNTGSVSAEIKRDGLTMETKTGNISITIPFMAADMGSYQNALAQLDYSKEMTKIKGVQTALSTGFQIGSAAIGSYNTGSTPGLGQLSAITSGAMQLAANAQTLDHIDYMIEHTAPNVGTLSTASAANAFFMDPRARLLIVRPSMLAGYDAAEYSHTIGNACCRTGRLADFNGYTVAASAVLDGITTKGTAARAATEQELQALRKALLNGVYL